jgi:hypothetical protein
MLPIGQGSQEIVKMIEKRKETLASLHEATVRPIFVPGDGEGYKLDDELLDLVRANFNPEVPTVIMVILGGQGLGKSTFCNHLIQHCSQSRLNHAYFRAANSTTHTTRGSHFLTCPLPFPTSPSQLLLVDMEGLAGTETLEQQLAILQSNLVGSVLAVASVPCFLIRNERETMRNVDQYLEKFVSLSRTLGCKIERILFLFHDKDFDSARKTENQDIVSWINQLNRIYFNDSPVILLLNKPNFMDSSKHSMRESFLTTFLSEADFPKRSISGDWINVREILVQIRYLGVGLEGNELDLVLDEGELQGLRYIEKVKTEELEKRVHSIESDGVSIVMLFNDNIRVFQAGLEELRESKKIKTRLRAFLDEKIREIRWSLTATQALYMAITALTNPELKVRIKGKVVEFYERTLWLPAFNSKCSSLRADLAQVGKHYPHIQPRVALACGYLDKKQNACKWKSYWNYALNIGLTAATGGLGAAASGTRVAVTAARYSWAAFSIGGVSALKFTKDLVSGLRSKKADQMLKVVGDRIIWGKEAMAGLSKGGDKCVMLAIGREGLGITDALNSLLRSISGMDLSEDQLLTSGDSVQVVTCPYPSRSCQCILFYIQFSAASNTASDFTLSALASALFPYVSITCIFNGHENDHLMNIVSTELSEHARNRPVLAVISWARLRKEYQNRLAKLIWNTGMSTVYKEIERLEGKNVDIVLLALTERLVDARVMMSTEVEVMMGIVKNSLERMGLV